ncbi:MAG: SDR family NAD(P)-dependent oxidoreductase [Anaerolineae bacterium]|nr:MAG: SDR family NAD(P)-dependent oxidoreductase [Anaerolineae bacterium]
MKDGNWTADKMPEMNGKVAIVTGANSGIGYETARALAARGAQVVIACRNAEKGATALQKIRVEQPNSLIELMQLDLADLSSIRRFVDEFLGRYDQLHLLINNAGVMAIPEYQKTVDGFEMQFGTNHLGHFALTGLLLETLIRTADACVVTLSSIVHRFGRMDFDNLNAEKSYNPRRSYNVSKLANLLFTYELQRRFEEAGVETISTASHPGWTVTNLQQHSSLLQFLSRLVAMRPEKGALPTLYAATAPGVKGGDYYGPSGLAGMRGYPKQVASSELSHNQVVAERLWNVSEELTGVRYFEEANKSETDHEDDPVRVTDILSGNEVVH